MLIQQITEDRAPAPAEVKKHHSDAGTARTDLPRTVDPRIDPLRERIPHTRRLFATQSISQNRSTHAMRN